MNRRNFLKGILAAGVAPYVVTTAGVLMPVKQIVKPWVPWNASEVQGLVSTPRNIAEVCGLTPMFGQWKVSKKYVANDVINLFGKCFIYDGKKFVQLHV